MKVTEHIARAGGKTLFSFELLPPLKGKSIHHLYEGIDPLMEFNPAFVNVTYHREEYIYKKRANGLLEKISIRKRPGTVGICAAIKSKYQVDTIPHLICGGFTKEETENALIDLSFLGIDNVLALRGDPIKSETHFTPEEGGHAHAVDLVKQITDLNKGKFLYEEVNQEMNTDFCIGVAGYPEKHFESPNMKTDLKYLKQKIDNGAHYIVTQLFYDNQKYFDFVEQCRSIGINVPIIPGLKPITSKRQLTFIPKFFHVNLPDELVDEIEKCQSDEAVKQVGIEWGIKQSKELMQKGVPCIHYYTMGKSTAVKEIAKNVF